MSCCLSLPPSFALQRGPLLRSGKKRSFSTLFLWSSKRTIKIEGRPPLFFQSPKHSQGAIMSRKINWSDAPFNWPAEPALDEKALNSPQPCSHGSGCRYDGPCAFVHKGEEGTGRRLFPARTVKDKDGKDVEQAACVRLIGSPGFYERRRLRLSWPEWCAKKGIQHAPASASASAPSASTVAVWPTLPPRQSFAAAVASGPPVGNKMPMWGAQNCSIEAALWQQAAVAAAAQQRAMALEERNEYGQKLFDKLLPYVADLQRLMGIQWPKSATAGKLTGLFLELDKDEWEELLTSEDAFEQRVKEGLDVLADANKSA